MNVHALVPSDDGRWISDEYARMSEIIQDYDYNLELRWIPPEHRSRDDKKPYVIWDKLSNTPVLFASELDTPAEIIATLFQADATKNGHVLQRLEAMESAQRILNVKARLEAMEGAADQAHFLLKSPLHTNRLNGKKFDHNLRVIGPSVDRKIIT
jgi:hypothetical protein